MSEAQPAQHVDRSEPPPLDKRLERFVQRYIDSPLKLEIMRTVAFRPSNSYSLANLQHFVAAPLPDIEGAVLELEHLGLVRTRRRRNAVVVSLSRSPVVRESSVLLSRYAGRPLGRARLAKIVRRRR